jgi:hypothetical protein
MCGGSSLHHKSSENNFINYNRDFVQNIKMIDEHSECSK